MMDTAKREWLLNLAATDIHKEVPLTDAQFNWLQERLRKLATDLSEKGQWCHDVRGKRVENEEMR